MVAFSKPDAKNGTQLPPLTLQLMTIVDALSAVMEEEKQLLEARNFPAHAEVAKRKADLAQDYQAVVKVLMEHGKSLSASDRAMLKKKGAALDEQARQNGEIIRLAHASTDRLLKVVMEEVRQGLQKNSPYSAQGHMAMAASDRSGPVACNYECLILALV